MIMQLDGNNDAGLRSTDLVLLGGRHSSVVSSAPTILRPRVRIPSTPSMLFQFVLRL